jgi:hypothetical protein
LVLTFKSPSFTKVFASLPDTGFETGFVLLTGLLYKPFGAGVVSGDSDDRFVIEKVAITRIITSEAAKEYRIMFCRDINGSDDVCILSRNFNENSSEHL